MRKWLLLWTVALTFPHVLAPLVTGCTPPPMQALQVAEASVHTAYRAAELVVAHLRTQKLTDEQTARLERAQTLLDLASTYLEDLSEEGAQQSCRSNVSDALEALRVTFEELKSQGIDIPPEVDQSLALASALARTQR